MSGSTVPVVLGTFLLEPLGLKPYQIISVSAAAPTSANPKRYAIASVKVFKISRKIKSLEKLPIYKAQKNKG